MSLIRKGNVVSIIDPSLAQDVNIKSMKNSRSSNTMSEQHGYPGPRMQEIILAIQDAIKIETWKLFTYRFIRYQF
uniref:Probable LRR receptor-like serine/threonine-protein kinase At1g67720 n=1 Tax=Tanacetum cinerariifolium TaxID=118510 RepID=A0A699HHH7_TANCI|nr:probable LRR receptor-like serine/threonine-protein kinase At1g67720 [Tanacetum cinerariifolium]